MADYQRILSYLYRYEKTEKKACLGFVKAEQKSGDLKLTIQIDDERLLQGMELKLCFYERQGEAWQVWELDTVVTQEHKEELHLLYSADKLPKDFRIKGQSGVLLYYQDGFYYGSVWIGEEIPKEVLEPLRWHKIKAEEKNVSVKEPNKEPEKKEDVESKTKHGEKEITVFQEKAEEEKKKKPEEITVESEIAEETKEAPHKESERQEKENILKDSADTSKDIRNIEVSEKETCSAPKELLEQQSAPVVDESENMWINAVKKNPPVDNIFNAAFYEGYKVSVAELKQLGEETENLSSNQFLLKGYERYHHLLAGKVQYAGEERYCIGVPGIYENREKYMAEIYQFPVFLSLTENRMKTGSFGYWLYLLKRE